MGRGPLDHLPDIGETVLRASASSLALLGGGDTSGPAIARSGAAADTPEVRALGKHAISPVGSTAVVEQVAVGATQLPPQRTEGAPGSVEDRSAPVDIETVPLPPPPPSQRRVAVPKRLQPHLSQKRPEEVRTLAPLKALKELETWSLGKSVFLRWERDVWDQLQWQKVLLASANELLSAWSAEVEDLHLRCADAKAEAAMAQLGTEQGAHQLTKGALDEALKAAEASQTEAVVWRGKAEELEGEAFRAAEASQVKVQHLKEKAEASRVEAQRWREKAVASRVEARRWEEKAKELETEVARAAEASITVQVVLETEIGEHDTLKSATRTACEALEVEGVQSGSSLGSRLIALSGQARE
ncbi:uncharacterized protein [Miscanthus floridulus]|uniref:uncharacterized protein n=1 Tax=Miscanthus floridulus TaxID=154761 RepID=UPI0034595645